MRMIFLAEPQLCLDLVLSSIFALFSMLNSTFFYKAFSLKCLPTLPIKIRKTHIKKNNGKINLGRNAYLI